MTLQELLRESLARLELGGCFGRAEDRPATTEELVHYSHLQRQFRADDGQVGLELVRNRHKRSRVFKVGWNALGISADPAIPGCAINFRNARRLAQLPHQCMLASAASNDEDFHSGDTRVGAEGNLCQTARGIAFGRGKLPHPTQRRSVQQGKGEWRGSGADQDWSERSMSVIVISRVEELWPSKPASYSVERSNNDSNIGYRCASWPCFIPHRDCRAAGAEIYNVGS